MTTSALAHRTLVVVGWVSLFVGLLIPFTASLAAIANFWNLTCTTSVVWSFAPLVLGCEPVPIAHLALGWLGTALSVSALGVAAALAVVCLTSVFRLARSSSRHAAFTFGLTAVSVFAAVVAVFVVDPDSRWDANNAWILFTSGAGLVVYTIALAISLIGAVIHRRGSGRRVHASDDAPRHRPDV